MGNKEMYIDGCDVSGCENYGETMAKTHNCTLYDEYLRPCKGANCHYKNWQRKEQECDELKKIIDEAKNSKLDLKSFLVGEAVQNEYEQQLDKLKAEIERLKKENKNIGLSCKYWFRPNPTDYRKCSLRGENDNCDEITDCFVKSLLTRLQEKEEECERLRKEISALNTAYDDLMEAESR